MTRWSFSLLSVDWSKWQAFAWRSFNGTADLEPPLPKWCGCTSLFLLGGVAAPFSYLSMVQLHLSFPSQWCSCTFLFSLNGAVAPLFLFLMVRLYLSLISQRCGCTFLYPLNGAAGNPTPIWISSPPSRCLLCSPNFLKMWTDFPKW